MLDRKFDTRLKIQLGGLIKKAQLDGEDTAVLLGLLCEAYDKLHSQEAHSLRAQWRQRGDREFKKG